MAYPVGMSNIKHLWFQSRIFVGVVSQSALLYCWRVLISRGVVSQPTLLLACGKLSGWGIGESVGAVTYLRMKDDLLTPETRDVFDFFFAFLLWLLLRTADMFHQKKRPDRCAFVIGQGPHTWTCLCG